MPKYMQRKSHSSQRPYGTQTCKCWFVSAVCPGLAVNTPSKSPRPAQLYGWSLDWQSGHEGPVAVESASKAPNSFMALKSTARLNRSEDMSAIVPDFKHEQPALLYPKAKLAFCHFAKVACTEWNMLFNDLNGIHLHQGRGPFYQSSYLKLVHHHPRLERKPLLAAVDHAHGWKFAYFTRDPYERYLSAWGSKCLLSAEEATKMHNKGTYGKYCDGKEVLLPVDKETMIRSFEEHVRNFSSHFLTKKGDLVTTNQHFQRQSDMLRQCGWDQFKPKTADFIGDLSAGGVHDQVLAMLKMANVRQPREFTERWFPSRGIKGGTSSTHDMNLAEFYRDKKVKGLVKRMYWPDFLLRRHIAKASWP